MKLSFPPRQLQENKNQVLSISIKEPIYSYQACSYSALFVGVGGYNKFNEIKWFTYVNVSLAFSNFTLTSLLSSTQNSIKT